MLILTRGINQSIKLGADITIVVLGIRGAQVRIGIDAPKGIDIYREEIVDRTKPGPTEG